MPNLTPFQNAILDHLRKVCAQDANFATKFTNPKKKIEDCCTYIINQVRKTGRQGFSDEEIYSMAIHYYQEDNIEVGKRTGNCQVVVNRPLDAPNPGRANEHYGRHGQKNYFSNTKQPNKFF